MAGRLRKRMRALSARRSDEGFTLMELLVAMMVITAVLITLMVVQTSALVTTAQTRQRTQATAFANQTMEELRALPWTVLSKGLHANFASASGGDPNVSSGMLHPVVEPSINETLVLDSAQATDMRPLSGPAGTNSSVQTDPSIPGVQFVSRAYVTRSATTPDTVVTLTVLTQWSANQKASSKFVLLRSEAYAPQGGCGDAGNQPFLGACQPLLSATGGSVGPATTITPAQFDVNGPALPEATPLLPGSDYTVATMLSGQAGVGITAQQSTSSDSSVLHPSASWTTADPAATGLQSGGGTIQNASSNDVGSSGAAPANPPDQTGVGSASPLTVSAGDVSLSLSPASGTSGVAKASMAASCATGIPAGQGCAAATQSGGSAPTVTLGVGGQSFGMSTVLGTTSSTFGARFTDAAGSTATGCTALSGAGCVSGGATRTVGTGTFGTGAWSSGMAPNGLVRVTGYSDSVTAQRGELQPTTAAVMNRSASISYWNGTGYSTLAVGALTNQTVTTGSVSWTGGGRTVTAIATVIVTPAMSIASNPDPIACSGEGCTVDVSTGTVSVSVRWTVKSGGTQAAFTVATSLGTSRASAAYKAAPSA